jgi:hypothetical protein
MANMSYCRFRNTLGNLEECLDHLHDPLIAGHPDGEHASRIKLVTLCERVLEACGVPADRPWKIVEHAVLQEDLPATHPPGQS